MLEEKYALKLIDNNHLKNLSEKLNIELNFLKEHLEHPDPPVATPLSYYQEIYMELLDAQRKILMDINHKEEFDEELIRKYLTLVDIEELKMRERQL